MPVSLIEKHHLSHHFDASRTSNVMFDVLAERSLMSPLAGNICTISQGSQIIMHYKIIIKPKYFMYMQFTVHVPHLTMRSVPVLLG